MNFMDKLILFLNSLTSSREDCFEFSQFVMKGGNFMTSMQVEYSKLKETQQHNRAMEAQAQAELNETVAHNRATEQETASHNRALESLQSEANAINKYSAELKANTDLTTAQIKAKTDLEKQRMINDSQEALKRMDLGYQEYRDKLDRNIEKVKVQAEAELKDKQKQKVFAEIEKLEKETSYIDGQWRNDRDKAQAALRQADASLSQAHTAADRLQEDQYMNEYLIDWREAEISLKKQENVRSWINTTTKTLTALEDLIPGLGGEDSHTITD